MIFKLICAYFAIVGVLTHGKTPDVLRDSSLLKALNDHYTSLQYDKSFWSQEDPLERKDETTETYSTQTYDWYPRTDYQTPGYWNYQSSSPWNYSDSVKNTDLYKYRPEVYSTGTSYYTTGNDVLKTSQSAHQYQKIRPAASSYVSIKKYPVYYPKTSFQVKGTKNSGSLKYKQPLVYYSSSGLKKTTYPRVHKPYAKHKYPAQKTVHSSYRRYYRSPYQQHSASSNDIHRKTIQKPSGYSDQYNYFKAPDTTYPTTTSTKYYTTERMDDIYSTTSEDNLNNSSSKALNSYYESYDEPETTTAESEEASYGGTSTRGYYGDRIYMSTQAPLKNYFIVRKVSDDDDIETIFE